MGVMCRREVICPLVVAGLTGPLLDCLLRMASCSTVFQRGAEWYRHAAIAGLCYYVVCRWAASTRKPL